MDKNIYWIVAAECDIYSASGIKSVSSNKELELVPRYSRYHI